MKIAITGGTGFLGSALVEELAADHEMRAVDLVAGGGVGCGDVLDLHDMEELCRGMEMVIHLASARWEELWRRGKS